MSDLKIVVPGLDYLTEQTTTQFVIPAGAGATFTVANNIATITFNAAHGLTFAPTAGTLPNFFIQFGGSTSGLTGTGILVGNVFRILSIPTTTSITIYTTITAATITSLTGIPVFIPVFQANLISTVSTNPPGLVLPYAGSSQLVNLTLGANCVASYNSDNTFVGALDSTTGNTPVTAPVFRTMLAASSGGQLRFGPQDILAASGTTATSRISICQ